jgi:hypothetical protein
MMIKCAHSATPTNTASTSTSVQKNPHICGQKAQQQADIRYSTRGALGVHTGPLHSRRLTKLNDASCTERTTHAV